MPKDGGGHAGHHPSPSLDSLFISLIFPPYHFPRLVLMSLSDHHYMFHFSTPLFFIQPLVCSLCAPFAHLFNLLPRASSVSIASSLPPAGKLLCYLITLTMQDAVCARLFFGGHACVCLSLFEGQVQGLGAHPTRYPHGSEQPEGEKTSAVQEKKNKIKYVSVEHSHNWRGRNLTAPPKICLDFQGP